MLLHVRVVPRSGRNTLEWEQQGEQVVLKARLTAPPVDGAANEALVALLAEKLRLSKRSINIVRGATSRQKVIEITDLTQDDLTKYLQDKRA